MSRHPAPAAAAVVILVAGAAGVATGLAGCSADPAAGWSTAAIHDTDIRTVAVPVAGDATFDRDASLELTEAIITAIESRTPWRVVPEARADTILVVRLSAVDLEQLSRSRATGLAEEMAITLDVDFEWSRMDTGRVLAARRDFRASGLFVASAPSSERIDLGRFDAVQRLADDIVDAMQADW